MRARILIADDDAIARGIMQQILADHGYAVTVADNGWSAVEMLGSDPYEIAIFDYHMPLLDGVAAARKVRELTRKGGRPRFIGVTADPGGLEERDRSYDIFDAIVQKPINILALLDVIDASLRRLHDDIALNAILTLWQSRGFERKPRAIFASPPTATARMQFDAIFDLTKPGNPDLILLTENTSMAMVGALRTTGNLFTLPIIDVTGRVNRLADAMFRPVELQTWDDVASRAKEFAARRMLLTRRFIGASDIGDQLLAYIFVSGHDLRPVVDLSQDYGISYQGMFPTAKVLAIAETLVQQGLLKRFRPHRDLHGGSAADVLASAPYFELSDDAVEKLTGTAPIGFPGQIVVESPHHDVMNAP